MKTMWKQMRQSLRFRLLIFTLIISVAFLSVTILIMSYMSVSSMMENMEGTVRTSAETIRNELEQRLKDADNILKHLQLDDTMMSYAEEADRHDVEENYFLQHRQAGNYYSEFCLEMMLADDYVCSMKYIDKSFDNIAYFYPFGGRRFTSMKELEDNGALTELFEDVRFVDYLAPHRDFWDPDTQVFSVARMMRDPYHVYGVLLYDYDVSELERILGGYSEELHASIQILDEKNILYSSGDESVKKRVAGILAGSEKEGVALSGTDLISGYVVSDLTGWTVVFTCRTDQYQQARMRMIRTVILLYVIMFAALSAVLYVITGRLTDPIQRLTKQIDAQDPSDLTLAPIRSRSREVTVLSDTIRQYLQRIDLQNKKIEEANQRAVGEHYKTLEAQLNPHFLYNTLTVIAMEGLESDNMDVFEMCNRLSKLLRYSLSYSGQAVPLRSEIENVQDYLFIMEKRFENRLEVTWETEEAIGEIPVPKLMLQPLVENCFQHAFGKELPEDEDSRWRIRICTRADGERWFVEVSNNGEPFPEEKIRSIMEEQSRPEEELLARSGDEPQGYGLHNTVRRLHIYYSGKEYVEIKNKDGWTYVCIGGPR